MQALTTAQFAKPFPLPFTNFIVVSAELSSLDGFKNIERTHALRQLLKLADVAFIEASGIYQGQHEACFVLPGMPLERARAIGLLFDQESILIVQDTIAHYGYTASRVSPPMLCWRVVDPKVDPCLVVPGFPPIQFF